MSATENIAASAQPQSAVGKIHQEDGPPGSGGWKAHAEDMERERDHWRQRAQTMLEHQRGEVWYWQGDGNDHPESMVNSLPVVIRADQLQALIAGGVQALSAAPNGWESVIDGARSGLQDSEPSAFDNSGYRAFAETVLDAVEEGLSALAASPTATAEQQKHTCTCPSGDGSLRWPCPQHPAEQAAPKAAPGEPSDAEIDAFLDSPGGIEWVIADKRERYRLLVRAVLAKWAAPQQEASKAAPREPFDECFPGEPRVAVPQGLISAACFAIRNKRDGGKVLEQLRRYSVGDLSQPLAPQQEAQEPATTPRFNCWSTNEGDSWFDHPADAQAIYNCLGNDAKVGDEYELTAGWKSVTARYRITEVVGDGEEYEVECLSHPRENTAPKQEVQEPHGWLYEWTHSSATGKPDSTYTAFTTDEAHARKRDNCRAIYTAPQPAPAPLSRDQIREVFMAHGFTIKEGQTDLKQYVYDAAHALLELVAAPQQEAQEPCPSCKNSDIYACTCTFQTSRNAAPNPSPLSNDVFQKTWRLLDDLEKLRSANHDEEDWGTLNRRDNELRAALAAQGGE